MSLPVPWVVFSRAGTVGERHAAWKRQTHWYQKRLSCSAITWLELKVQIFWGWKTGPRKISTSSKVYGVSFVKGAGSGLSGKSQLEAGSWRSGLLKKDLLFSHCLGTSHGRLDLSPSPEMYPKGCCQAHQRVMLEPFLSQIRTAPDGEKTIGCEAAWSWPESKTSHLETKLNSMIFSRPCCHYLVILVVWNMFYFSVYWE